MLSLVQLAKRAEKLVTHNSPAILTAAGVAGTITTAYLVGKATFKAAELIRERNEAQDVHDLWMPAKEKVELVWKLYIPAVTTGLLTVTCIVLANRIEHRRAVALAAAFTISEKALEEYKAKIVEKVGARKEQGYRDEIAQDRVNNDPLKDREVILIGTGEQLCYDLYTGRYFRSDVESIRKAVNDINLQVINDSFASLSDFYDRIGLSATSISNDVGWNLDTVLDVKFTTTLAKDGQPCIAIDFKTFPIRGYSRLM